MASSSDEASPSPLDLTVVIPCLDAAQLLPVQLEAFAAESVSIAWEVVVVDNGSKDQTAEVARSFADRLPLTVTSEPRRGRHHACNAGASIARGLRLAFVDADDRILPGYVEAMNDALRHSEVVGGRLVHEVGGSGGDVGRVQEDDVMSSLGFWPHVSGANFGVTREAFIAVGGFDDDVPFAEDIDLSWRLYSSGYLPGFARDASVVYAQRADLSSMFKQHLRFGRAQARLYRKYRSAGMPRRNRSAVAQDWLATAKALPFLRDRGVRARAVRRLARNIGRVDGSVRSRVVYL